MLRQVKECRLVEIYPPESIYRMFGLCCDGTLFPWVSIVPDDKKDHNNGRRFLHPYDHHQKGLGEIYHAERLEICCIYNCMLLHRFSKVEISFFNQPAIIIQETIHHVNRIWEQLLGTGNACGNNLSKRFEA